MKRIRKEYDEQSIRKIKKMFNLLSGLFKERIFVVEGKKDEQALKKLGANRVVKYTKMSDTCSRVKHMLGTTEHEQVIILTDNDRTGTKLMNKLEQMLRGYGIRSDEYSRRKILAFLDLKYVENIAQKYKETKQKIGA